MRTLRKLALNAGQTFAYPRTRAEASREIERLIAAGDDGRVAKNLDRDGLLEAADAVRSTAAAIRDEEISGYGASATWSQVG